MMVVVFQETDVIQTPCYPSCSATGWPSLLPWNYLSDQRSALLSLCQAGLDKQLQAGTFVCKPKQRKETQLKAEAPITEACSRWGCCWCEVAPAAANEGDRVPCDAHNFPGVFTSTLSRAVVWSCISHSLSSIRRASLIKRRACRWSRGEAGTAVGGGSGEEGAHRVCN